MPIRDYTANFLNALFNLCGEFGITSIHIEDGYVWFESEDKTRRIGFYELKDGEFDSVIESMVKFKHKPNVLIRKEDSSNV